MPAPLLHVGAVVTCPHAGQATPTVVNPRVLVSGQPIVTQASPYVVAGCTLPPNAGGPDTVANWVLGAVRVFASAQPVLLMTSQAVCVPTASPLLILSAQPRVLGT